MTCWGGCDDEVSTPPLDVRFRTIAAGFDSTCGVTTDGLIRCWAPEWAKSGACMDTNGWELQEENELDEGRNWVSVTVDDGTACALSDAGELACIGSTRYIAEVPAAP